MARRAIPAKFQFHHWIGRVDGDTVVFIGYFRSTGADYRVPIAAFRHYLDETGGWEDLAAR